MSSALPGDAARPAPHSEAEALTLQALDAQQALLPQALGVFAVCLPFYVWAGSYAANSEVMAATFSVFAINWGAFYIIVNWLKRPEARDVARRQRIQILGGLLWAGAVAQIAAMGAGAGAAGQTIMMMAAAAAVICLFFAATSLPGLLIVGPAAMAGPLLAMFVRPESRQDGVITWGAFALAFLLALLMNRNLRRQFVMAADRERLSTERERSLAEAERLARSKSDLVATLSHEIRNGLTGVAHVLAAAAGQNGRAAPSREQLGAALAAANDLIAVLNATLDTETAQAGRLTVDAAPFDPVRTMRELSVQVRQQAAAKGLEFSLYVEPELEGRRVGAAVADVVRVRQVLANLLSNAVKYTLRGRIEARVERKGEGRLTIAIADTGPGLTPEELRVAFEPFKRVARTAAGVSGAGLGLSLSRQLVRLMDAALVADSAVGVGSCFTLELPYDSAALIDAEDEDERATIEGPGGLRVLMAEDEALNAAMLRGVLEQLGHKVVHAQNGRRAVELARIVDFDVIMLDGRMPEMDGPEVARAIRALPGPARGIGIVAMIAGDADEARECLDAGADTVMRKPVTVSGVARALAEIARRAAPALAPATGPRAVA
ncbi:ATP-binding protein [Caulobacter sp. KR2-114]|uniref:ATP-binding protein n=1 Tax=Caulobacter sp. KR2-114 TaxID=3400912 RepID=UPI003C07A3D1